MTTPSVGRRLLAGSLGAALGAQAGILDLNPGAGASDPVIVALGTDLYVAASTGSGRQLLRFDSVQRTLVPIVDAGTGLAISPVTDLVAAGTRLFFTCATGTLATVWLHDPAAGNVATSTTLVRTDPTSLTAFGNNAFFAGSLLSGGGSELWITDGSLSGTRMVVDANPSGGSLPQHLTRFGNRLIYEANDGVHGREPWISDGTAAGTHMLRDIHPNSGSTIGSDPLEFVVSGAYCYFSATDGSGRELWRTDGTSAGTTDVQLGSNASDPTSLADLQGTLYFSASGGNGTGRELWCTVSGSSTARLVVDLRTAATLGSDPAGLVATGGALWFSALRTSAEGRRLFRYSPAVAVGSANPLAIDLPGGTQHNVRLDPIITPLGAGGAVAFVGDNGLTGFEPWASGGGNATLLANIATPGNADPDRFTVLGGELFFTATDRAIYGREVFFVPLGGTSTAIWIPLGVGCARSNGAVPTLELSQPPRIGTTVALVTEHAVASGLVVVGFASHPGIQRFGQCTLRLGSNLGAVQSTLWLSADPAGVASLSVTIPASIAFIGQRIVCQALALENGGPFANLGALTNAVDVFLGN